MSWKSDHQATIVSSRPTLPAGPRWLVGSCSRWLVRRSSATNSYQHLILAHDWRMMHLPLTVLSRTGRTVQDFGVLTGRRVDPDLAERTPAHWPDVYPRLRIRRLGVRVSPSAPPKSQVDALFTSRRPRCHLAAGAPRNRLGQSSVAAGEWPRNGHGLFPVAPVGSCADVVAADEVPGR
jgi:hypothetical protein